MKACSICGKCEDVETSQFAILIEEPECIDLGMHICDECGNKIKGCIDRAREDKDERA